VAGFGNYVDGLMSDPAGNLLGTWHTHGVQGNNGARFVIDAVTHIVTYPGLVNLATNCSWMDSAGNLYGTTYYSDIDRFGNGTGYGTVCKVAAGTYDFSILATFSGTNGAYPKGNLISDLAGNLYGTTSAGGDLGDGTVFKLDAATQTITALLSFSGTDGAAPLAGLIFDAAGNLYGTTSQGGDNGDGTIFELAAGTNELTTLLSFNGSNGREPVAGLVFDSAGNLYGTTEYGGDSDKGTVFELSPVPEPASLSLLAMGALAMIRARRE
jgi:uncharacterized repeat protein (TIGR03803 family)